MTKLTKSNTKVSTQYLEKDGEIIVDIETTLCRVSVYITKDGRLIFTDQENGDRWSPRIDVKEDKWE